jgi:PAS domain S-box-containing protein
VIIVTTLLILGFSQVFIFSYQKDGTVFMSDQKTTEALENRIKDLEAENAQLQKSECWFRSIVENNQDAIVLFKNETILYANAAWADLHDVGRDEIIGKTLIKKIPTDPLTIDIKKEKRYQAANSEELLRFVDLALKSGRLLPYEEMCEMRRANRAIRLCEFLLLREDGSIRWTEGRGAKLCLNDTEVVLVVEKDITENVLIEQRLKESEEKYRALFDQSIVGILLMDEHGKRPFMNNMVHEVLGYTREEFQQLAEAETDGEKSEKEVREHNKRMLEQGRAETFETQLKHKNGELISMLMCATPLEIGGKNYLQTVSVDITDRKKAEEALKRSYENLEGRIEERTRELRANSEALDGANTALRVLLNRTTADKEEIENKVLTNIRELVLPSLKNLKNSHLNEIQLSHLDVLELNLKDVASPFLHHLTMSHLKFTPSEIQIANLIKQGKSTKDIAAYLNLSPKTISAHRNNIRKKLGLDNKRANLKTHLLSIK